MEGGCYGPGISSSDCVSQEGAGFCLPGRLLEKVPEKALGTPREQPPCDGAPQSRGSERALSPSGLSPVV